MIQNEENIELGTVSSHAVHHKADGHNFIVIAPPLFEESVRLRKVLVNLSRFLCDSGFDIVRLDYFGSGFSPGEYVDLTMTQALADLNAAIDYCIGQNAARIIVVGVRFGGYLALLNRIDRPEVNRVITWEPVVDLRNYMREVLRGEVSTQMLIYGKVRNNQAQLIERLLSEGQLFVEGYCISSAFFQQLNSAMPIDYEFLSPYKDVTTLIYWQSRREQKRWSTQNFNSIWLENVRVAYSHIRYLDSSPERLFNSTLAGIQKDG